MKNIKLLISYDGTGYLGWQRLGGKQQGQSIQGLLEHVIEKVVQYPVRIHGSAGGEFFCAICFFYIRGNRGRKITLLAG